MSTAERLQKWRDASWKRIGIQLTSSDLVHSFQVHTRAESLLKDATVFIIASQSDEDKCTDLIQAARYETQGIIHLGESCRCHAKSSMPIFYTSVKSFLEPAETLLEPERFSVPNFSGNHWSILLGYDEFPEECTDSTCRSLHDGRGFIIHEGLAETFVNKLEPAPGERLKVSVIKTSEFNTWTARMLTERIIHRYGLDRNDVALFDGSTGNEIELIDGEALLGMRRYWLQDKIRAAKRIGLLSGATRDDEIRKRVVRACGEDVSITQVSMMPVTPEKLDNFEDIEIFVWIGCPTVLQRLVSSSFEKLLTRKIVSAYEFFVAFGYLEYHGIMVWDEDEVVSGLPEEAEEEQENRLATVQTRAVQRIAISYNERNYQGVPVGNEDIDDVGRIYEGKSGYAAAYESEYKSAP